MNVAPTLEDVARAAGVSRATASRVVRGDVRVTGPRADAVRRAVRDLGYVPNNAARALVTRSTDAIALIVPEPGARVFTDPFFGTAVAAISARLALANKQLLLVMAETPSDHDRLRRFLHGGHADGLLVISHHEDDTAHDELAAAGVPVVHIGRPLGSGADALFVDVDNVEGGRRAARRLVERGCTRLATITGPGNMAAALDRLAGFEEVARESGVEVVAVLPGDFTFASGETAAEGLLALDRRPDGVFVANDLMAIGALRRIESAGLRVPDEIAIVGFDDIDLAAANLNRLTTVVNPVSELGTLATSMLLDAVAGARPEPMVLGDPVLRVRATA